MFYCAIDRRLELRPGLGFAFVSRGKLDFARGVPGSIQRRCSTPIFSGRMGDIYRPFAVHGGRRKSNSIPRGTLRARVKVRLNKAPPCLRLACLAIIIIIPMLQQYQGDNLGTSWKACTFFAYNTFLGNRGFHLPC